MFKRVISFFLIFINLIFGSKAEKDGVPSTTILPSSIKSIDYIKLADWPKEMILEGPATQWEAILFEGEELIGVMWKSAKGKLLIDNYPFDQMVRITKGTLYLTATGKPTITYKEGDIFILPKGFKGIWEMPEEYEEFIIAERKKYK